MEAGFFLSVDLLELMTIPSYKFSNWVTSTHTYLTIVLILYDYLTACDASDAKIFLEKIIFLKDYVMPWERWIFKCCQPF